MLQAKAVEKIKTHFMCNFFKNNCVIYEIMWKNIVASERPQMTIWHILHWVPKATNTHTQNM